MWLVNANVVDVLTGEKLRDRAVQIGPDGRIVEVASAPPVGAADAQVVDVAGRWLLPGLISCHTHLSVVFPFSDTDEREDPAVTAYRSATRAHQALQAGITTIRCVHEQNRADLSLRRAAARGWISAPRIRGAGRAISTVGGHGEGAATAYATGEEEFYRAAAAEIAAGADHVKIFINGGLAKAGEHYDSQEMADEEIRGVVRAARDSDKYVVAHSGESIAIRQALAQGVTSFEHAYRLDEETARRMVGPDIFLTPTLCVTRSESWMRANHFEEHSIQQALAAADDHLLSIQRAIRAGVTLVNGTDYPPGDLVDGVPAAVHEMLLMAEAGLTPLQALQSVSTQAARLLRIDDHVGQVRPGYVGDLIAVDGDPLDDLDALRHISLVVQAGSIIRGAA
ncbi:Imidazolonepropionase [Nakamurella panacisegetis]|uniref:Imidazolonepropionase n=1 Tax=Nakamurella panacisegetis TaxID=1090615 RepID=A0A1H0MWM0_9ACTN|nr:amidohydrolase family protein [Nakamurella panacisegetis]SDO84771.1 Imidazolonepropionase [Nakamurella panacisegetis]